ncbi:MAG: penicillin-binding protein 2 [Aquisalimonadaceae bacterium]
MAVNDNNGKNQLRDQHREQQLFTRRAVLAGAGVLGALGLLGARMAQLQVLGHQHYTTMSLANRVKLVPMPPNRGLIHDRNGVILAENRPTFQIMITPEQVPDLDATLQELAEIIPLEDREIERFLSLRQRSRRFDAVALKFRLNERDVAAFATNRHRFPGVEVEARLTRFYPQGAHAVHAIGHVGRINERELSRIDPSRYRGSTHMGKAGAELQFEERLHGHSGIERVETNAMGRVIRPLERVAPNPGNDVFLTIDSRLQRVAEDALGEYAGALVAIDVRNGDVLALASKPTFDPNLFVHGIDLDAFRNLQENIDKPLFNRALRGQYPPGSTVKPFMALAGLEHGTMTPDERITCYGHYSLPGIDHRWRCWKRQGHGPMDLNKGIVESCDVYFYDLAYRLGIDNIHAFLSGFGFGQTPNSGMPGELGGILPSRQWKRANRNEAWYHGETLITGIGQGFFLTTPLQLAQATAVLARRGEAFSPRLIRAIRDSASGDTRELDPEPLVLNPALSLRSDDNWEKVVESMVAVVHSTRGTARSAGEGAAYQIAGKTGTAQVFSLAADQEYDEEEIEHRLRDHALFNAFAPARDPRIAVAVIVENGGSGGAVAAPMARKVMDAFMDLDANGELGNAD